MKKQVKLTAAAAIVALSTGVSYADEAMEKCKVVRDGEGLIKAHKADCAGANHSCAGHNEAGDPEAWILVPEGLCAQINAGALEGIDDDILEKIDVDAFNS